MRGSLLAVAVLATIAITSAVDEECLLRKVRGLPVHWPNPTDCSSFYRCTNKNVKRELLCPEGKEYNPNTGRCAAKGRNLCKLSLKAPLSEVENPCADKISGTFVPAAESCRDFMMCDNNVAYPQSCKAGSYFNTELLACVPDNNTKCWENLCVNKTNGEYLANDIDCYSFYICYDELPKKQICSNGSHFSKSDLNCQPGPCPEIVTTTPVTETTTPATENTTPATETTTRITEITTPTTTSTTQTLTSTTTCLTTTTSAAETTTPTTTTCTAPTTTPTTTTCITTTTTCTTPTTTTCTSQITTPTTTTCTTTRCTTTTCTTPTTTICTTTATTCTSQTTTPTTTCITTTCTTPTTTTCKSEITTPTTTCTTETTTLTTTCAPATTTTMSTPCSTEEDKSCPSSNCLNQPDYFTFPATNTTSGFCRCLNEKAEYYACIGDCYLYNDKLGVCTKSNDCEEEPTIPATQKLCEGGYKEGDFVPNPDNCMLLSICFDGELEEISCEIGNYYDAKVRACMPNTEGQCPAYQYPQPTIRRNKRSLRRAPTCMDNAKTPAADCDMYYKCTNGVQLLYGCGKDKYFNPETLSCEYDWKHRCWPATSCVAGEKRPHPTDCDKYFECCSGTEELKECSENYYYNKLTQSCELDTKHVCWAQEPCTCPGGYKEGQISAHPDDCDKYYICQDGQQVLHTCAKGNYFNKTTGLCELDENNVCSTDSSCVCPGGYKDGDLSPHPTDCDKYYICDEGKQVMQECYEGNYFDNITLACEPDVYNECWPTVACTCPGGYAEGEFSKHPTDCNKYYICNKGHQVLQDCGVDSFFNNDTMLCERDTYHVCWPNLCVGVPKGTLVANPQQCNAYYLCEDDIATPGSCYEGEYFDARKGTCLPDFKAICYDPCANETSDGVIVLPHYVCNKFYFCNGGKTYVGECVTGSFDPNTGVCNETKICQPNPCKGQYDFMSFPYPYDPTKFYVCIKDHAVLKQCESNTEFNTEHGICMPVSNRDCPVCPDLEINSYPTLDGDNDREFCYCYRGIAYKSECSNGYVYNPDIGTCYSNAPCDPAFCIDKVDYTVSSNRNCTKSFCMCISHKPVVVNCPNNGTFNPITNECTSIEISPECDQSSCVGMANGQLGDFTKGLSPNGLCVCRSQIATFEPCAYRSTYNPTLKICQQKEINCNSKLCTGLADNTNIPALTTNEGYCKCVKGQATYYNCLDGGAFNAATAECDAPVCPLSQCKFMGDSFKPINTSDATCVCLGDSVDYVPCSEGQLYSEEFSVCADKCKLSLCPAGQTNYNIPSAISKHDYCTCDGQGNAAFKQCSPQYYRFNMTEQQCVPDVGSLCTKPCTNTIEAYKAEGTLEGFCICNGKGPVVFQLCNAGTIYNPHRGICVPLANSICNVNCCKDANIESPITMPAEDDNKNIFCYCSGPNDVMVLICPAGKEYVQELGMCVNPLEVNSKCPVGTANGAQIPDNTSCNKYFICENGQMVLHTCPSGQYFNKNTNQCCIDTQGVCNSQTECSCLGAYYEGEMLKHPLYDFMYYVCENGALHEYKCPQQQIFSVYNKGCIRQTTYGRRKRSTDTMQLTAHNDHEFNCNANEKRSVPSNCSQFEVCINRNWQRESCPNYRYYNPEQKKCLEPRDDFVCAYARITSLPTCDDKRNNQVYQAKSCYQYYHCENRKWRLKSCARKHYFQAQVKTCLPVAQDAHSQCNTALSVSQTKMNNQTSNTCQHLSQRFYAKNCAMFLICLDNEWWYQYCPAGMYFNRSLNYCMPDLLHECVDDVVRNSNALNIEEYSQDTCNEDGLLRPSAMACNRYFVCLKGKWQMQHCATQEFYDVANARCSLDTEGRCNRLNRDCWVNEKRSVTRNCSLYEQCSSEGKWLEMACNMHEMFDESLQQCVASQDICSKHGLKRVCRDNEFIMQTSNCTQFYYCSSDSWQVGSCLKGFMFSDRPKQCVPHQLEDICSPRDIPKTTPTAINTDATKTVCQGKFDGSSVAHATDCTRYYICIKEKISNEMQCSQSSFFDAEVGYCLPNDGSCRVPLTGLCANATYNSLIAHPTNCQAFYHCSPLNGTELLYCPNGEYFHNQTLECRPNNSECKNNLTVGQKCGGLAHGSRIAHETYCNKYYTCVKGLAIPVECPDNYFFSALLNKCVFDKDQQCRNGQLVNVNVTHSCGILSNGSYLPDIKDCTRYFICSKGQALPKKCANSSYFNSELLLCVPDDGSCPFVNEQPAKLDPEICEGKHGYLMADPLNCHNFYACTHNRLKHERCYSQQFFNNTSQQCQPMDVSEKSPETNNTSINEFSFKTLNQQCLDKFTSTKELCKEFPVGTSLAESGDCRRYLTCQEADEEPLSQRCRNGESFDSLLGFCRQNDGTCLMENGQRVGECSGKHGQLARDPRSCRGYFVCINGQKIAQTCADDEYFSKTHNMCLKDTEHVCNTSPPTEKPNKESCIGLSEYVLYPYINDNCRSYFQCIKGVAKIHKCADDLYFDAIAIKCVTNKTECVMPTPTQTQTMQRSKLFSQKFSKLCTNKVMDMPYANLDNDCRSFYVCHANGEITHELCPLGKIFNKELNTCFPENETICR